MKTPQSIDEPSITITIHVCEAMDILRALRLMDEHYQRYNKGDHSPPQTQYIVTAIIESIHTEQPQLFENLFFIKAEDHKPKHWAKDLKPNS